MLLWACAACSARASVPWLYQAATAVMMVVPIGVFGVVFWWVRRVSRR
jgi:hypothetical protein